MLSEKEKAFMQYWERERVRLNKFSNKILAGLPMAIIFSMPILLFVVAVYLYFPEWYTKVSKTTPETFVVVIVAVFLCILFFSYFRMQYKWEKNEEYFEALKRKESVKNKAETLSSSSEGVA